MNIRTLYYPIFLAIMFLPNYSWEIQNSETSKAREIPKLETLNVSNDMLLSLKNKRVLKLNTWLNELAKRYDLDGNMLSNIDKKYWLREWTTLCIAIAETWWWKKWRWRPWCRNYWNVWKKCFNSSQEWLEAIWKTLNNKYLKNNKTIWCLTAAWECILPNASKSRYAMDNWNRQKNVVGCFYQIYKTKINPKTFNLHTD